MWSVGLDVHLRVSTLCILDENGKTVKTMTVRGSWVKLLAVLREIRQPFAICYEASCGYGYLYDRLRKIARRVVVAHPGHLRLIFRTKKKNDRLDAKKLATLLFLGQVPPVHVPSADVRGWRSLIQFRHRQVGKRTRVKNGLRSLLRGAGVEAPRGGRLWTRRGRGWLATVDLGTEAPALQRDVLLEELEHLERQIARVERELNERGRKHPGVVLLQTIRGVGPRTAEAAVAYIDDPKRFARNKCVGSYFGLVPSQDSSAGWNRLGHITREGPAIVRKLLTEAAWQGIRLSPHLRARFERIQGGNPDRRKIALIATAHYLIRVMHSMLQSGEPWRWDGETTEAA